MKKFLCLMLSLVLLLSISAGVGLSVSAYSFGSGYTQVTDGDFVYQFYDDGTNIISDYIGKGGEVTIPSEYNGENTEFRGCVISGIFGSAFKDSGVTVLNIPDTITHFVGDLSGCYSLTEINVDDNNSVYSSQDGVLFNKDKTELLKYPEGNVRREYTVPDGVISIVDNSSNDYLEIVNIADSVESIGNSAFSDCDALFEVNIGSGIKSIGDEAFSFCDSLSSIKLPEGLTSIGESCFERCVSLGNVTLPNSLVTIGDRAFYGCENITEITIPENVTDVGYLTFTGCSSLTEINVEENNAAYSSLNGILFNKDKTILIRFPQASEISSYAVPESVITIDEHAFLDCYKLAEVSLPDSLQTIMDSAFSETGLVSIVVPENVNTIGFWAFNDCENLKSVIILNPDCDLNCGFEQAEYTFPNNITLYGYLGSTTQEYVEYYSNSEIVFTFMPIIEEDTDTEYIKDSSDGAKIHCSFELADFVSADIDGVTVDSANYTLSDGSTIITFAPAYLDTLSAGDHIVTLNYTDKTATSVLTVKALADESTTDNTDNNNPVAEPTTGNHAGGTSDPTVTGNTAVDKNTSNPDLPNTGAQSAAAHTGVIVVLLAVVVCASAILVIKKKKVNE